MIEAPYSQDTIASSDGRTGGSDGVSVFSPTGTEAVASTHAAFLLASLDSNVSELVSQSYSNVECTEEGQDDTVRFSCSVGTLKNMHSTSTVSSYTQPLKTSFSFIIKALRSLKQSVTEVVRVLDVEVELPGGPVDDLFGIVSVNTKKLVCCRRRLVEYGRHNIMELTAKNETLLTASDMRSEIRVPQKRRIEGRTFLRLQLVRHRSWSFRRLTSPATQEIACFRAPLPYDHAGAFYLDLQPEVGPFCSWAVRAEARVQLIILRATQVFDIVNCRPRIFRAIGYDEWRPSTLNGLKDLWDCTTHQDMIPRREILRTMTAEMKKDVILMYQTLFAQSVQNRPQHPPMTSADYEWHDMRVLFLKRLFLAIAVCRLMYCIDENSRNTRPWPFPIASSLCHGSRILFRLDGVRWQDFLNLLLFGSADAPEGVAWSESKVPMPFRSRWAASHAVCLQPASSQLCEVKLTKRHSRRNITDGLMSHHLGMDLPVGGLGNPAPENDLGELFVGPAGRPFLKADASGKVMGTAIPQDKVYVRHIQNGHLYLRWDDFGVKDVPVLMPESSNRGRATSSSMGSSLSTNTWEMRVRRRKQMGSPAIQGLGSRDDLHQLLVDHGYRDMPNGSERFERLYEHLIVNRELSIHTRGGSQGGLRCHGVVIQLVIEMIGKSGQELKVLVQKAAAATEAAPAAGDNNTSPVEESLHRIEDQTVPTVVRRRNESWESVIRRFVETHLDLRVEAADRIVMSCRQREDEMRVYPCPAPRTVCHHHRDYAENMAIDHEAYRFKCTVTHKDRDIFGSMFWADSFVTTEKAVDLHGFNDNLSGPGTVQREWEWLTLEEASRREILGVDVPDEASRVVRQSSRLCSVLIGIEGSAAGKQSFFGSKHNLTAKQHRLSAFGKRKWRDYRAAGQEVPADIGGMHVSINESTFKDLQTAIGAVSLHRPSEGYVRGRSQRKEKALFRELLESNSFRAEEVLRNHLELVPNAQFGISSTTQVLDSYVLRVRPSLASSASTDSPPRSPRRVFPDDVSPTAVRESSSPQLSRSVRRFSSNCSNDCTEGDLPLEGHILPVPQWPDG
mmetsp:Transcript_55836/g.120716  ORF Transcript_55836/g.120716 Transcript_55836/m.120716 type:complete len:1072 (+) Transcript_55836:118-3333(+)